MLAKISQETMKLVGAENVADFESKLSTFITEANSAKTFMAESKTTLESLQASITALEGKLISEERVKAIVAEGSGQVATKAIEGWAASEVGKKIIGAEASRVVMEASAAIGTIPVKPAPTASNPAVAETKTFAQIVQGHVASGKSNSAAVQAAIESNPEEYKAYLKTGGTL